MPRHALVALTALALAASVATPAAADEPHVHVALDWSHATGCLDEPALRSGVEAHLGRAVFEGTPDVRIVGRVARAHGGSGVVLELSSTDGESLGVRTLHVPRAGCRALDSRAGARRQSAD